MNLATFASFTAAGISLATLVVTTFFTGRRERLKWAREALAEAYYHSVDVSYRAKDASTEHQHLLWAGAPETEVAGSAAVLRRLRDEMLDLQTRITLLAPRPTFNRSQELRRRVQDLQDALGPELTSERLAELVRAVAAARSEFIDSAKRSLALPR